jgi:hypothetical protein
MKKNAVYLFLFLFMVFALDISSAQSRKERDLKIGSARVDLENSCIWIYVNNLGTVFQVLLKDDPLDIGYVKENLVMASFIEVPEPGTYRLVVSDSSFPNPPILEDGLYGCDNRHRGATRPNKKRGDGSLF